MRWRPHSAFFGLVCLLCLPGCGAVVASVPVGSASAVEAEIWPAFAVYRSGDTTLVPVLPPADDESPVAAPGLWLLDDEAVVRAELRTSEEVVEAMGCELEPDEAEVCDAGLLVGRAGPVVTTRWPLDGAPETVALTGDLARCACFARTGDAPDDAPGEDEPCAVEAHDYGPVSVVGGVVHLLRRREAGCGREPSFEVDGVPLLSSALELPGPATERCVPGLPFDDWAVLEAPCPRGRSRRTHCGLCRHPLDQGTVPMLWSGNLVLLSPWLSSTGQPMAIVRTTPVDEQSCPSGADPCGASEGFVGLDRWDSSWVAPGGEVALAELDGRLFVLLPGLEEPFWGGIELGGAVIGVRFHEDATPLRERMEQLRGRAP